jgi:hypothetical protein
MAACHGKVMNDEIKKNKKTTLPYVWFQVE